MAIVLSSSGAGTARAANLPYSMSVTPFTGGYVFEGNQNIADRAVYGISVGYNLSEHWGLEATYSAVPNTKILNAPAGVDPRLTMHGGRGDILYHFFPDQQLVPYVAAGAGILLFDRKQGSSNGDIMVDYGAGLKFFLIDSVALRADVRHIFDITYHDASNPRGFYNHLAYTAGITFQVGGVKPAVPPVAEEKPAAVVAPAPAPVPEPVPQPAPPKVEEAPVVPPAPEKRAR